MMDRIRKDEGRRPRALDRIIRHRPPTRNRAVNERQSDVRIIVRDEGLGEGGKISADGENGQEEYRRRFLFDGGSGHSNDRVIGQRGLVAERGVSDFRVAADEAAFADDRIADFGGLPDARAGQQHRVLYPRAFLDDAVRAERRVDDFDAGFEDATRIDHRARVDLDRLGVGLVYIQGRPRHVERLQSPVDQILVGLQVAGRRADVYPVAGPSVGVKLLVGREQGGKELVLERELLPRRNVIEHARLQNIDAGVDRLAGDLFRLRLLDETPRTAVRAGLDQAVCAGVLDRDRRYGRRRRLFAVIRDQLGDVDVGQNISVEDYGRLVQALLSVFVSPGGAHRRGLDHVANAQPQVLAGAENALYLVRLIRKRKRDVFDPGLFEQLELIKKKRAIGEGDYWFRRMNCQRSQTRAFPTSQN